MTKPNPMTEENPKESVALIKLSDLKESPYQGRFLNETTKNDNSRAAQQLDELTASIESSGMMQPIIVRQVADGYEIIDGHRRVMAHKNLGRGQVRAIIKDCTEREAQIMAVVGAASAASKKLTVLVNRRNSLRCTLPPNTRE